MRFVLLHYHIFKNAGSTVKDFLDLSFGERFERVDKLDANGIVSTKEVLRIVTARPRLLALSSHQFCYPMPAAPGFLFFDLCFLRDPLERVRSTYSYLREKPVPGDPLSDLVNTRSLGDFVSDLLEYAPHRISNLQTNLLANGIVRCEAAPEEWLDRAITRMVRISFLGIVDCFDRSIAAGHALLNPFFPRLARASPRPVNVSENHAQTAYSLQDSCSPAVYRELVKRNRLDFELLTAARSELNRRLPLIRP